MRILSLDYQRRSPLWAGWALSGLVLVLALEQGYTYFDLSRQVEQAAAAKPQRARHVATDGGATELKDNLVQAGRIVQQLSLPWDSLFRVVEKAQGDDVALLTVQPDAQKGLVQLSGEARDYAALLTYVVRLGEGKTLSNVHLLNHAVKQDDPQRPISFTVVATWMAQS